jgi:hypothetical protein
VLQSVAAAEQILAQSEFDFAFLDVKVTNGKTFEIASSLMNRDTPLLLRVVFYRGMTFRRACSMRRFSRSHFEWLR